MPRAKEMGFSLVDVIVGTSLMLLLFLALFGVLRASLVVSAMAKAESAGVEVANTQMEYLRGLSYDSLGTVGGIPAGPVPQFATSTVDGVQYVAHTYVEYYDDPADGIGINDTSVGNVTTDYKVGKVNVSYKLNGISKTITLVSNFVPPGLESSTGGGTLVLHIVNAAGANVSDASVQIVNASTSPTVNFTTFSDSSGLVMIGGAATSSMYQVYVSNNGYSSAQTYARTGQNVNPTPGYLTVAKNQTTSATFAIDLLSTLKVKSLSPATTTAFIDPFIDASNLAAQTGTQVTGGGLVLAANTLAGSARSTTITPSALMGWGILSATIATPGGTTAVVHVDDASGTLLPDAVLPGNAAGFSTFPVSLTDISTSTYPSLSLQANLTSPATTTTSTVDAWSLSYSRGPVSAPNISFSLTGAKTIGTTGGGQSIYKTTINDTTGSSASTTETLEWDSYTLGLSGANLIESCPASPYPLMPAQASSTSLIVGNPTATTLPLAIEDGAGNDVANAKVVLTKSGYAATVVTSACGLAYFGGLTSGTYTATVSAAGHTTRAFTNISVAGHTATTTLTLP
jgi:type II secretory pathway pseudopilin PulG